MCADIVFPEFITHFHNVLGEARNFTCTIVSLVFKLNRISLKEQNWEKKENLEEVTKSKKALLPSP